MLGEQIWRSKKLNDLEMSNLNLNSVGRPLARTALTWQAIRSQMQTIIDTRDPSSEDATVAREFAQWFDLKHDI